MAGRQRHEGYLMVDHRASPGFTEQEARAVGYDPKQCGEGKLLEAASLTCSHCKTVVRKNPLRTREREYCPKCDHYICDFCKLESLTPDYTHLQYEQFADVSMTLAERGIVLGSKMELLALPNRITKIQS